MNYRRDSRNKKIAREKEKAFLRKQDQIKRSKKEYQQHKLKYDKEEALKEAKRGRPPLDIGSEEFDPKSIIYSFETVDHISGNKYIKSMYIGDSRFYGHTDDGIVIDADMQKSDDYGLEEPKGLSVVFFLDRWS